MRDEKYAMGSNRRSDASLVRPPATQLSDRQTCTDTCTDASAGNLPVADGADLRSPLLASLPARLLLVLASAWILLTPSIAGAEEGADSGRIAESAQPTEDELTVQGRGAGTAPAAGAGPGLDALLKLPSGFGKPNKRADVAGTSEAEWRRRFESTSKSLRDARASLEKTKAALDGAALSGGGSQWSVAAPGGVGGNSGSSAAASNSPLSFKLRQQLRENRRELEEAERAMRELRIQADLAGVPVAWRGRAGDRSDEPPPEVGQLLD